MRPPTAFTPLPRVVIVGAGFGGLAAARALARAPVEVVVVDRHNYHLFQPLLYQVATAGLSPADIAWPIRGILRRQRNAAVLLARVSGVDVATRTLLLEDGHIMPYDFLVLATGARHSYFGRDEWEEVAPGLKKIDDATAIRRRVLMAFEQAEGTADAAERRRLLNFVVIGGGPTGVELAGAIAELAKVALAEDFRTIDPREARIVLIEAGPRVLATFPESLSRNAECSLRRLGVEVVTGSTVTGCDAEGVSLGDERLASRTVLWAAGVAASPAGKWLAAERDRAGRIVVGPDFSVPGHPDIFAIGDTCAMRDAADRAVPGVAPAAKQGGRYVAGVILAHLAGRPAPPAFRYRDWGNMATIGRKSAVCDFGRIRLTGFPAWILWGVAHVYFLIGLRNRATVALNWLWSYLTFQRGARLITGGSP
ncbi:MAG TPA: NAD(P)/FAD-dependent oxidoreductase [Geminicoccaceae bacterium]|nr:NAD(P)/FAD-dependent oxidoreductase [Geminicoccus sp.]HMU49984.1 NAD(P)/FAD-dependent oxidoreductase [Geminicoccaceae bacterium]